MRIAYVDYTQNIYTFGGVSSYVLSLLDVCGHLGAFLDVYTGSPLETRSNRLPPEIVQGYHGHVFCDSSSAKIGSRYSLFSAADGTMAVNTLLGDTQHKVHDLIIFGNPILALLACLSGLRHPRMFVYLHQHELFLDMGISSDVLPKWSILIQRDMLKHLPIAGCLTQCEENIIRIKDKVGIENIFVVPITMPGFVCNYEGERSGWAYLGSGEKQKNPELAVEIFNRVGNQHVHFYVSRSVGRLKKLLGGARFPYTIYEKLSRRDLMVGLQKRVGGIHCAQAEGFGLSVSEQMHYYPVLLYSKSEYVEHFPSALSFGNVDEGVRLVEKLSSRWADVCQQNSRYLGDFGVGPVATRYTEIMGEDLPETNSGIKVRGLLGNPTSYAHMLSILGWQDYVLAAGSALRWKVGRRETRYQTYLLPDGVEFTPEVEGALF